MQFKFCFMKLAFTVGLMAFVVSLFIAHPAVAEEDDHDEMDEIGVILVQATRSRRRVQDQPTRIEVIE